MSARKLFSLISNLAKPEADHGFSGKESSLSVAIDRIPRQSNRDQAVRPRLPASAAEMSYRDYLDDDVRKDRVTDGHRSVDSIRAKRSARRSFTKRSDTISSGDKLA